MLSNLYSVSKRIEAVPCRALGYIVEDERAESIVWAREESWFPQ